MNDGSIRKTIERMMEISLEEGKSAQLQNMAEEISRGSSDFEIINSIFKSIKSKVTYCPDVSGAELIKSPFKTLSDKCGDVGDLAVLSASILNAAGFQTRFVTTIISPEDSHYSHVYSTVLIGDEWIPIDLHVKGSYPGWEGPYSEKHVWPIMGNW